MTGLSIFTLPFWAVMVEEKTTWNLCINPAWLGREGSMT